ncbi:hypothetical protein K502DRAFT_359400 [Neoconidiobolus thromboides FSU 785]|nr:hypothetical protein K502DRAFT_359400 [Neoconidiobolus thromboides FSU 785]
MENKFKFINYENEHFENKAKMEDDLLEGIKDNMNGFKTRVVYSNAHITHYYDIEVLNQYIKEDDLNLISKFYSITDPKIIRLFSKTNMLFLIQNASMPAYKLALYSVILVTLSLIPELNTNGEYDLYLYKVNVLFNYVNKTLTCDDISDSMIYYINKAMRLLQHIL